MKRFLCLMVVCLLVIPSALAEGDRMAQYEAALRQLLCDEMGMPADREATVYRGVFRTGEEAGGTVIDPRPRYGQNFHFHDSREAWWSGWMAAESGTLIVAEAHFNDDWISMKAMERLNANDPKWEAMAWEQIARMRKNGMNGVREVVNDGETVMNGVYGVTFRFILEDGGAYTVFIVYALNQAVEVIYRDAAYQANYEDAMRKLKIMNQ